MVGQQGEHTIKYRARPCPFVGELGPARSTLLLGGLSGIASGVLFIAALVLALTFAQGAIFADMERFLASVPASPTTIRTVVRLNYVAAFLYVPFLVSLWGVATTRRTMMQLGVLLGTVAAGAAFAFAAGFGYVGLLLGDAYASASASERMTIVVAAQAALGVLLGLQQTTIFFFGFALMLIGMALLRGSGFHKAFGWLGVILGVVSVAILYTPGVPNLAAVVLVAIFGLMLGTKLLLLSRTSA